MLAMQLSSTPDAHFYAESELINIMSVVIVACSVLLCCLPPRTPQEHCDKPPAMVRDQSYGRAGKCAHPILGFYTWACGRAEGSQDRAIPPNMTQCILEYK